MGIDLKLTFSTRGMTGPGGTEAPPRYHTAWSSRGLKMPTSNPCYYRFFFLHTTTFNNQFKCIFAVYLAIYIFHTASLLASLVTMNARPLCKLLK